jgi:hypothetical protein
MKISQVLEGLAVLSLCGALLAGAQTKAKSDASVVGEKCDLAVFGAKDTAQFLAFDRDLRAAIEQRDMAKLALLVEFPLRVDDDKGAIFIHDASSLEGHFDQIFTPEIRKTVLSSTRDTIWCNYSGIDYGNGNVWVNVTDKGFFLMTVNLPAVYETKVATGRTLDLACHTDKLRIVIDSTKDGTPRYRSWSFARSLGDVPDLEIAKGESKFEGTGPCAHRSWTFHAGKAEISLEDAGGCVEVEPPKNATAELFVRVGGEKEQKSWCF